MWSCCLSNQSATCYRPLTHESRRRLCVGPDQKDNLGTYAATEPLDSSNLSGEIDEEMDRSEIRAEPIPPIRYG
jgi:hypothetical protein